MQGEGRGFDPLRFHCQVRTFMTYTPYQKTLFEIGYCNALGLIVGRMVVAAHKASRDGKYRVEYETYDRVAKHLFRLGNDVSIQVHEHTCSTCYRRIPCGMNTCRGIDQCYKCYMGC